MPAVVAVVPAPGEGGLPGSRGERPAQHRGRRGAVDVDLRLELFGAVEMAAADLAGPVGRRVPRRPRRPGVPLRAVDLVPILVRLAGGEVGFFDLATLSAPAQGGNAEGDVGSVETVMDEGRLRVV